MSGGRLPDSATISYPLNYVGPKVHNIRARTELFIGFVSPDINNRDCVPIQRQRGSIIFPMGRGGGGGSGHPTVL